MNQRLVTICLTDGEVGGAIGDAYRFITTPCNLTIIFACVSPRADQADQTVDINDDGSGVITAIDASDADVPGTWKSTHMGGTNAPIFVAAGSKLSFDLNNNTDTDASVMVHIWALAGEVFA